ncbi:MAG TPA: methylthioribulose 1-phosphate dehydratase [Micropepsaceae bacterium]|nr:methylthioribulose 1-phosphate dehydratase [Micropepsaceae bacterium]HRK69973.1 methylthioribulose 1-phosphate dehydratase [Micropepsaceae bacterium]
MSLMAHEKPLAAATLSEKEAIAGVIALAHFAGARGMVPATAGNFSVRMDATSAALTATGCDKGAITEAHVITVPINGPRHPRASAEGELHLQLYRDDPAIGAIAHVHHKSATVLSRRHLRHGHLRIAGWELLKVFRGITTHETHIDVPIFDNSQDMQLLAHEVSRRIEGQADCFGYLLAGHGLYVWGKDVAETRRHLEGFDALFDMILAEENGPQ